MPIRHHLAKAMLALACALAPASQAAEAETPHWVHYRLLNSSATTPKKVVIVPASVKVFEVTAGGVDEEVPDWTREASRQVLEAVSTAVGKGGGMHEFAMPRLSAAEAATLDEHRAPYKMVAGAASTSGPKHKVRRFEYGIGPGLWALLNRSGAGAAVLVVGRDVASTAGRKAKAVLGKIPLVNILTGPDVQLGHTHAGVEKVQTALQPRP